MSHDSNKLIAIAGGGLLGRLLAWQLLRKGFAVHLYEAGAFTPSPAAAFTAAGMISPYSEAVVSDYSVYRMGLFALDQWQQWVADLQRSPEQPPLFHRQGSLVVAHPQDVSELQQFQHELRHILPGEGGYRTVNGADIRQLEPDLQPGFQQGLLLENEGHLDNRGLLDQLFADIQALGGQCFDFTPVLHVKPHTLVLEHEEKNYPLVIDCRGLGARSEWPELRGVRGETLHVQTREIQLQRPVRLMHPRYQLYIVPKPDHRFMIGATQIESEDRTPISLQSSLELSSALYTLSPAFAEARIVETGVNLRPAFMNNMPRVVVNDGIITANGLFRHGYLLAPAVVCNVMAAILNTADAPFNSYLRSAYDHTQP